MVNISDARWHTRHLKQPNRREHMSNAFLSKSIKILPALCFLCLTSFQASSETELTGMADALCQATPGNCSALRKWCHSEESGSKNPGACILINFVKTLSNQSLCRKDPSPKECLAYQVGYDSGLQNIITRVYENDVARSVIDDCTEAFAQPASDLGLNAEKQALLEQALEQFEQEYSVPLRMYDSRLVLDCINARL